MSLRIVSTIFALALFAAACKSPDPCPQNPPIGHAGSTINTEKDDYLPVIRGDKIYFTSIREKRDEAGSIYSAPISEGMFGVPTRDESLPLSQFRKTSSPSSFVDPRTEIEEIYFAAVSSGVNSDIFVSRFVEGEWTPPEVVEELSSEDYESHPAISPDGRLIAFLSDRPGGFGDTDVYLSFRTLGGDWTEPRNAGVSINTEKTELSPMISEKGDLYFASKGFSSRGDFDILVARSNGAGSFGPPDMMPFPINVEGDDDTGPAIWRDRLLISSNRRGGCGGFDIYTFELCGPVFAAGEVSLGGADIPMKGEVKVLDEFGEEIMTESVGEDGVFQVPLAAGKDFTLRYYHPCIPNAYLEQAVSAPCSDSSVVKMIVDFGLPPDMNIFSISEYNAPFFATGYYLPNTRENLDALRNLFEMGALGRNAASSYIENPGEKYDRYALVVEKALEEAMNFLLARLRFLDGPCLEPEDKLLVKVSGFADPRPLSGAAKYLGPSFSDDKFGFEAENRQKMDNELLSKLRAYFTAKFFENKLSEYEVYTENKNRVLWEVSGMGVDDREPVANDLKRRVSIEIGIIQ